MCPVRCSQSPLADQRPRRGWRPCAVKDRTTAHYTPRKAYDGCRWEPPPCKQVGGAYLGAVMCGRVTVKPPCSANQMTCIPICWRQSRSDVERRPTSCPVDIGFRGWGAAPLLGRAVAATSWASRAVCVKAERLPGCRGGPDAIRASRQVGSPANVPPAAVRPPGSFQAFQRLTLQASSHNAAA